MLKVSLKSNQVSESRNVKRPLGRIGLSHIKRGINKKTKKYNRKIIKANNTTSNSSNTTNSSDNTETHTIFNILNESSLLNLIPDDTEVDCKIHTNGNYYN